MSSKKETPPCYTHCVPPDLSPLHFSSEPPPQITNARPWNVTHLRTRDDWPQQGRRYTRRRLFERGKVDVVISTLTMTRERAGQVDFSEAYFLASLALLVQTGSAAQETKDLAGSTIAVIGHSTGQVVAILSDDTILQGVEQLTKTHNYGILFLTDRGRLTVRATINRVPRMGDCARSASIACFER